MFCDSKDWLVNSVLFYIPNKTLHWTWCSKIQEILLGNSSSMLTAFCCFLTKEKVKQEEEGDL